MSRTAIRYGLDPVAIDLNSDGALQHGNRYDQAVLALHSDDDALDSGQRAALHGHELAFAEEWPWADHGAGRDHAADGSDLALVDFDGSGVGRSYDGNHARRGQDG